ncbi:MAG: L-fuculose kinase [Bacilli bacterium]|nr:L-fuculose kinase [Bacilli bacterium]
MKAATSVLAFDLGASSGRAIVGQWNGDILTLEEIHRFPNDPVQVGERLQWDILRLYHEIKQGLLKAKQQQRDLKSMGIDSWAVDFGMLGSRNELLENPYHYRDHRTEGVMEAVNAQLGAARLFARTGIQFLPFNTLYQLVAMKNEGSFALKQSAHLLMIPDLLRFFLTGEIHSEFTNASTTQLLNPITRDWDRDLLDVLALPNKIFSNVVKPGTAVGSIQSSVCEELGISSLPVIAVGEHDTASAVAAVPAAAADFAYLICGTWSLLGTELSEPVLEPLALQYNFTNEGGVQETFRLLKNIMGLWLVQECKRAWDRDGLEVSFADLVQEASQAEPFSCLIDPDDEMFLNPRHMPQQIVDYCRNSGQKPPQSRGQMIRCILESLAFQYRTVLAQTEQLAGKTFSGLHMTGGGIHNKLLCQFTANAIGKPVWAGPVEGSAIGNILMQLISLGELKDLAEARAVVRRSFSMETFEAAEGSAWNEAYQVFLQLKEG